MAGRRIKRSLDTGNDTRIGSKAQLSVFLILGIVLLVIVSLVFYLKSINTAVQKEGAVIPKEAVSSFIEECIESTAAMGITEVGIDNPLELEAYLDYNTPLCTSGFQSFVGFSFEEGTVSSDVKKSYSGKELILNVTYPVKITKGISSANLKEFHMVRPITASKEIRMSGNTVLEDFELMSSDGKAMLRIKAGTRLTTRDKGAPDEISITEIRLDGLRTIYDNIVTKVAYRLEPDGLIIDPSAELTIEYGTESGASGSPVKLSYFLYDEDSWVDFYPGSTDYRDAGKVTGQISHFTDTAPTQNSNDTNTSIDYSCDFQGPGVRNQIAPEFCCKINQHDGSPCPDGFVNCDCWAGCKTPGYDARACAGNGDFTCVEIGDSDYADGFFSMDTYNDMLIAGGFGYELSDKSMNWKYPPWSSADPGLKGITESVCDLQEYNGKLYANTENKGYIFRTSDGDNWEPVYPSSQLEEIPGSIIGCGLDRFDGYLYAVNYDNQNNQHGKIIRTSTGDSWETVLDSGDEQMYLREIVAYKDKIYAFSVVNEKPYWHESADGKNWDMTPVIARYFRGHVYNDTLWLSSAAKYSDTGRSGLWKYTGGSLDTDLINVYSDDSYQHFTDIDDWNDMVFVGASVDFKASDGRGGLYYTTDGQDVKLACDFAEPEVWALENYNDSLYVGTMSYGGTGKVYEVRFKSNSSANGTEKKCCDTGPNPGDDSKECGGGFLWKPESETGKLAILLPEGYTSSCVVSVHTYPVGNNTHLETGSFTSYYEGTRPVYRFSKEGSEYGSSVAAVATCDGLSDVWPIVNSGHRCE